MTHRLIYGPLLLIVVVGVVALDYLVQAAGSYGGYLPRFVPLAILVIGASSLALLELYRLMARRGMRPFKTLGVSVHILLVGSAGFLVGAPAAEQAVRDTQLTAAPSATWDAMRGLDAPETAPQPPASTEARRAALLRSALTEQAIGAWRLLVPALVALGLLVWSRALWLPGRESADHEQRVLRVVGTFFGLLLVTAPFALALLIRALPLFGLELTLVTLLCSRFGDVGAYVVGKRFGRHALIRAVSPKKTIEGAVGGLCVSVLLGVLLARVFSLGACFPPGWPPDLAAALMGLILGLSAQLADLVASAFKRWAAVKDSSRLIPEFGGMLDLTDGFLFSVPMMYVMILLVWAG